MNLFGLSVLWIKNSLGLTLEVIAGKCGTHKGYVSGWIHGSVNPPSPSVIKRIAKAYGPKMRFTYEELLEISWVCKAPKDIRTRECRRVVNGSEMIRRIVRDLSITSDVLGRAVSS